VAKLVSGKKENELVFEQVYLLIDIVNECCDFT
jgi:hypothetical protein